MEEKIKRKNNNKKIKKNKNLKKKSKSLRRFKSVGLKIGRRIKKNKKFYKRYGVIRKGVPKYARIDPQEYWWKRKIHLEGALHIYRTHNNTMMTLTAFSTNNSQGWLSPGKLGFKGTNKTSPLAVSQLGYRITKLIRKSKMTRLALFYKGIRPKDNLIKKILRKNRKKIIVMKNITTRPHNGCPNSKRRRK